jgi:acetyl esterase/lipase
VYSFLGVLVRRRVLLAVACLVVAFVASGCSPFIVPAGPAPLRYRDDVFANVTKTADVTYGSALDQQGQPVALKLDVYEPTGDDNTERPAIVWIHGGGFTGGDKISAEIVAQAQAFARKGYFTVSINYRLAPLSAQTILNARYDAQAAVRFLRARASTYDIDPDRIATAGTSAGAITALNVAYNSHDPGSSGNPGFSSAVGAAVSLSGALLGGSVDAGEPPSLLFHGTTDTLVPYQWAVNTANGAAAAGVPCYLITYEGEGHVPIGPPGRFQQIIDMTRNFLYAELDLADAEQ